MEQYQLENDITVMYVTASSFPAGVMVAHQKLHGLVPLDTTRKYFGLSRPEGGGGIVYKAAAEELATGDSDKYGLPTMVIPQGTYNCITIHNYMQDMPAIGAAFQQLLAIPGHDPNGYCVEWYLNDKDVQCMVRFPK
jgi:predicted transcriptional regulator YdeE